MTKPPASKTAFLSGKAGRKFRQATGVNKKYIRRATGRAARASADASVYSPEKQKGKRSRTWRSGTFYSLLLSIVKGLLDRAVECLIRKVRKQPREFLLGLEKERQPRRQASPGQHGQTSRSLPSPGPKALVCLSDSMILSLGARGGFIIIKKVGSFLSIRFPDLSSVEFEFAQA